MVSFRNWTVALTGLALFTGLASAQLNTTTPLNCSTAVSVTPSLRAEGFTEQTGDVTLACTGGSSLVPGSTIPQVNVQVFFTQAVTSRLLPAASSPQASEALLLVDEPGSGLPAPVPNFGPGAPQTPCTTPNTGCQAIVGVQTGTLPDGTTGSIAVAASPSDAGVSAPNIFQGIVSGNSVTFFGVPVLPPVTAGLSRVFRITNIRVNANAYGAGAGSAPAQVVASISISGATSLLISNPNPVVGFVQNGLAPSTGVSGSTSLAQCVSASQALLSTLSYTENFGTAFKTRVAAMSTASYAGQATNAGIQNVPGTVYQSESNLIIPIQGGTAGLADYGTRLKATFNLPAGFTGQLWVSTVNVTSGGTAAVTPFGPAGGSAGNGPGGQAYAQLVSSETVSDGNGAAGFPSVPSTSTVGTIPVAQVSIVNGVATAVWEVVNTNPNAQETFRFNVYASYTSNVAQNNPPAPGSITVNQSFAPTTTVTPAASSTLTIPRFAPDANAPKTIATFTICRTVLLYPYVTNQAGFDTGIAIANTSTDPFSTVAQQGACTLNWYQGATNPAPSDTGTIATGTVYVNTASVLVPGFQGYMIALCNFQYAHGFAFVSDVGARELAMGYLALVLPDPAMNGGRQASSQDKGHAGSGEAVSQ